MATDKLIVNLSDNDELRGYLTAKGPGDTCQFEVEATLDDATNEKAVFSIISIDAIRHAGDPMEYEEDEGKGSEAVMSALGKKSKGDDVK